MKGEVFCNLYGNCGISTLCQLLQCINPGQQACEPVIWKTKSAIADCHLFAILNESYVIIFVVVPVHITGPVLLISSSSWSKQCIPLLCSMFCLPTHLSFISGFTVLESLLVLPPPSHNPRFLWLHVWRGSVPMFVWAVAYSLDMPVDQRWWRF